MYKNQGGWLALNLMYGLLIAVIILFALKWYQESHWAKVNLEITEVVGGELSYQSDVFIAKGAPEAYMVRSFLPCLLSIRNDNAAVMGCKADTVNLARSSGGDEFAKGVMAAADDFLAAKVRKGTGQKMQKYGYGPDVKLGRYISFYQGVLERSKND